MCLLIDSIREFSSLLQALFHRLHKSVMMTPESDDNKTSTFETCRQRKLRTDVILWKLLLIFVLLLDVVSCALAVAHLRYQADHWVPF